MQPKNFLVKIFAYSYSTEFTVNCLETPIDIENAIIDRLGKPDIKWEYLGEMHDPRVNRITYEEVIHDTRPIQTKKVLGVEVGTGAY